LIAGNKERETHRIIREGLKDVPLRWELYGRDHIYDLDFIADRMVALIKDYKRARGIGFNTFQKEREKKLSVGSQSPSEHLSFRFQTGKVIIDLAKCIAPTCGFACVKADRWYGRGCLKIEGEKPALAGTPEQLEKLCNECLACEVECELHGGKAITIELPLYGIEEFRRKHGASI